MAVRITDGTIYGGYHDPLCDRGTCRGCDVRWERHADQVVQSMLDDLETRSQKMVDRVHTCPLCFGAHSSFEDCPPVDGLHSWYDDLGNLHHGSRAEYEAAMSLQYPGAVRYDHVDWNAVERIGHLYDLTEWENTKSIDRQRLVVRSAVVASLLIPLVVVGPPYAVGLWTLLLVGLIVVGGLASVFGGFFDGPPE